MSDSSDLSSVGSLSPPPPSEPASEAEMDDEMAPESNTGILKFFKRTSHDNMAASKEPSPPPRKREPSPPHEYTFADNFDIAFIVMFRSRFDDALPRSTPNFGPQELESDVLEETPGARVEQFLCALLGLILNRKQDVKAGHYGRALEEAINLHKSQWPPAWEEKSPLSGGATFASMKATERITLLRALILWSLHSSEAVRAIISKAYKQTRTDDDLNQPLSVQSWGSDSDKRRYFLIEGKDHNSFRVYRESNPAGFKRTWQSVADSVESIEGLQKKLKEDDGGPKAKKLAIGIDVAMPRFLESQDKRARRDYRQKQKDRWTHRPDTGFSLYEGRTRGKKAKYTFSDDEDMYTDSTGARRSARNTRNHTPAEGLGGQVTTQSGRQVRPTRGTRFGENGVGSVHGGDTSDGSAEAGRPRRAKAVNGYVWVPIEDDEEEGVAGGVRDDGGGVEGAEDNASESDMGDDERDDDHVPESSEEEEEEEEDAFKGVVDDSDEDDQLDEGDYKVQSQRKIVTVKVNKEKLRAALDVGLPTPTSGGKPSSAQNLSKAVGSEIVVGGVGGGGGGDDDVAMMDAAATPSKSTVTSAVAGAIQAISAAPGSTATGGRPLTPEPMATTAAKTDAPPGLPRTPSAGVTSGPLAFRGSPEKPHMTAPRSIDVKLQN